MKELKNVHFVGIGGISMSALAEMCLANGYKVSGSDCIYSSRLDLLKDKGIKIFIGHSDKNLGKKINLVVYSYAIDDENVEILEAKQRHIKIISRAELLGQICSHYNKVIAVAGSHGKTTTTAMISSIFLKADKNPTIHIGGDYLEINGNLKLGSNNYFITEACEYRDSFLSIKSDIAVVLNSDLDHVDYFKNQKSIQKSFQKFIDNTKANGLVVISNYDKNSRELMVENAKLSYSFDKNGEIIAKNVKYIKYGCFSFDCYYFNRKLGNIKLKVAGRHNVLNSLAAISVALFEKIDFKTIKFALQHFKGVDRRWQYKGDINGAKVYHDYAHHPVEIRASLTIARSMCKRKIFCIYEPHTFSRTNYFWEDFVNCFNEADKLFLFPIYPAREIPIDNITSERLVNEINEKKRIAYAESDYKHIKSVLFTEAKKNDLILIMGAGNIVNLCDVLFAKN